MPQHQTTAVARILCVPDPVVTPTPDPDPTPDPTPDPDPGPDTPPTPPQDTTKKVVHGWFELPLQVDKDGNGIDDVDTTLYYASHSFTYKSKEYRNYTVGYSAKHHCPLWVAAPRHSLYSVKNVNRTDAYRNDPDIPDSLQYGSKSTGGGCNKGHMLGSAERLVSIECNRQVFYYTNIAPQFSSGFNTGGGGWNLLEDWIDGQVCADTLYEVVGCYFEDFTDKWGISGSPSTISFGDRNDVTRPSMFYYAVLRTKKGNSGKKVSDCTADELQCAAFVRAHVDKAHKGHNVCKDDMYSIAELEKITGLTYFVNVPNAPKTVVNASDWGL